MIPTNPVKLDLIAGEFVLGVLERDVAREVEAALDHHPDLRGMVTFWEEQLNPMSRIAPEVEPPANVWPRIVERLGAEPPENLWSRIAERLGKVQAAPSRTWNSLAFWRTATAAAVAVAACLVLYIGLMSQVAGPRFVAELQPPQGQEVVWLATAAQDELLVRAVRNETAPIDRAFELWAVPPGAKPQSLGVIPSDGTLRLKGLPTSVKEGVTLAISIEPKAGSPTGQPTGPVVFAGTLVAVK
jgi:anti-sigma-K factor RskA